MSFRIAHDTPPNPIRIFASEVTPELARKLPMREPVNLCIHSNISIDGGHEGHMTLVTLPPGSRGWRINASGGTNYLNSDVIQANDLAGKEGWWVETPLLRLYVNKAVEPVTSEQERHEADIKLIGEMLDRKAQEHGWCSEYEDVVKELNEKLNVSLPGRSKRKRITATIEVTLEADLEDVEVAEVELREYAESSFAHSHLVGILDADWSDTQVTKAETTVTAVEAI